MKLLLFFGLLISSASYAQDAQWVIVEVSDASARNTREAYALARRNNENKVKFHKMVCENAGFSFEHSFLDRADDLCFNGTCRSRVRMTCE